MAREKETMIDIIGKQKDCEFSLRFLLQNDKGQWKNCFTLLKVVKKGSRKEIEHKYGEYVVAGKLLTVKEGLDIIEHLFQETNRKLVIPSYGEFDVTPHYRHEFLASKQKQGFLFDDWPMRCFSFDVVGDRKGQASEAELLQEGLPYYPEVMSAILDFFELPLNFFNSYGSVYVVVNDYRARIEYLKLAFSKVQAKLDFPEMEHKDLWVKAFAQSGLKIVTVDDIYPTSDLVEFDIGFNPEKLHVVLYSREDNCKLDAKEYGTWRSEEGIIVERPEEEIVFLSRAGESQNLEYKGDIVSEENKNDFIETVVAFSNSNNGIILVGVANDGRIIGTAKNPEDLQKLIHDCCDPPPQNLKIGEQRVAGNKVIIINVPKGEDPPYQSKRDINWYVRHNATDMKMERSELMRTLEEKEAKSPRSY